VRVQYSLEVFMNIVEALHEEEAKLQTQLTAIQGAIAVLNGAAKTAVARSDQQSKRTVKRTMPASVRARISRKAKARWAKIKAEQVKKAK
jgi:hypothetical protein